MLAFARETQLSETCFIQSPTADGATYRNRIWTMGRELPFAGHPSLGAAVAVAFGRDERTATYRPADAGGAAAARRRAARRRPRRPDRAAAGAGRVPRRDRPRARRRDLRPRRRPTCIPSWARSGWRPACPSSIVPLAGPRRAAARDTGRGPAARGADRGGRRDRDLHGGRGGERARLDARLLRRGRRRRSRTPRPAAPSARCAPTWTATPASRRSPSRRAPRSAVPRGSRRASTATASASAATAWSS